MTTKQDPITVKYHFKDIENGQIAEGYTIIQIVDNEAEVSAADEQAMMLAEKSGGELTTSQGKPPANPEKYAAERREKAREQAVKDNQSTLTKEVQSGDLTTPDAPRLTDPVARQQQQEK
jgi:hypothetical protein